MDLVTVMTFDSMTSLTLVQSFLEQHEIESYVKDEYIGTAYSGIGINELRIKLQVHRNDAEKTVKILVDAGYTRAEDYEIDDITLKLTRYYEKIMNFFRRKERRR